MGRAQKLVEGIANDYLNSVVHYKHSLPRLIWSVVGLGMLTLGCYCAVLLVIDYLSYPSYTEISSLFTNEYYLPAITICNMNLMNKTKMKETTVQSKGQGKQRNGGQGNNQGQGQTYTVYALYQAFMNINKARSDSKGKQSNDLPYDKMNELNLQRDYRWDIRSTMDRDSLLFAKDRIPAASQADYVKTALTEMGNCLEINDNQLLVQKVNGPVGGLSMILDTKVEDYLETTEAEGFYILLRMPNETVISKEYAFAVSPGQETFIQLKTTEVTRLPAPHGNCQDDQDIFVQRGPEDKEKITNSLSIKECFTSQVLWKFMNEQQCKCYPWYVYARHIEKTAGKNARNTALEDQLYKYFAYDLPKEKRINFDNSTCYHRDEYSYSGGLLETISDVENAEGCATKCKENTDCVVFMFVVNTKECTLFDETAELSLDLDYRVTRGETNCTLSIDECPFTSETECENIMIDTMMSEDNKQKPMECHEPCSYNRTTYAISSTNFPSAGIWNTKLSASFPHYKSLAEARKNLVKLVFYQEVMTQVQETQTAAYNWRSFAGELGGALDLFVGISFMTLFKVFEWLICLFFGGCKPDKNPRNSTISLDDKKRHSMPEVAS